MSQHMTELHDQQEPKSGAARLFDLRILIGGLFTFYGVVLIIAGIFASPAEIQKASGININLWMGIGMLVVGLLFLAWWQLNPLELPELTDESLSEQHREETTRSTDDRNPLPA